MRRPVVLTTAVLVVAAMFLGTGCSMLSADEEALAPPPTASVTTDPGIGLTVVDEANRGAPLDISGTDLDGKPLALADSRGDITVVNGWASWCSPCRAEMPEFAEAAQTFEGQGVTFVGINVEDNEDDARAFTVDTPDRSIVDKDGTLLAQIPAIPPRSLPVTVILDRDGRVAVQIVGPIMLGTLEDTIASVIASEA